MWIVHVGTLLSAYFILAANSFMQNPVGYRYNPDTGRAELTDFVAVLTNKVQLVTFPHVVIAAYMVGGAMVMAVALWHLRRRDVGADAGMYRRATRLGAVVVLVAGLGVAVTGDIQGKIMTEVQPMKMAAAEALYESSDGNAPFSLLTVGSLDGSEEKFAVTVPGAAELPRHRAASTAASRASTSSRPSTRRSTAPATRSPSTRPTPPTSRCPTGASG